MRAFRAAALWLALAGCTTGGAAPQSLSRPPAASDPVSCEEAVAYETAAGVPEIRWRVMRPGVSSDTALGCLLGSHADDGTIELKAYLSSGLYRFVRECPAQGEVDYRLFEYENKRLPYLLRLHTNPYVDPKTYVVVGSHRQPAGNTQHEIAERSHFASGITLCSPQEPDPD